MRPVEVTAENPGGLGDFPSYQGLMWRTLAALARRGHFVPPDEGRDVIHDFYVEAWEGVRSRYKPERAKFTSYLIGAFMRFAARRLGQMQAHRSQLVDLDTGMGGLVSDHPQPDEQLESSQQAALIRSALEKLPGVQRQLLIAYVMSNGATERELAARMSRSRHSVRQALADAFATLAQSYAESGLHATDARLLQLAWGDGRLSEDIAAQIGIPIPTVRLKREQYARQTLRLLRESVRGKGYKPEEKMNYSDLIKFAALSDDRAAARQVVAEHAIALRELLSSEEGGLRAFSPDEFAALRDNSAHLAEVYEILYPPDDEYEDDVSASVQRFTQDRVTELRSAFEDMVVCLPKGLRAWSEYFEHQSTPNAVASALSRSGSEQPGEAAAQLARFGLTPEIFAQTWGGFGLLFEQPVFERQIPASSKPSLYVSQGDRRSPVYFGDLCLAAQETPGIPDSDAAAEGLAKWTLDALRVLPLLVPNYRAGMTSDGLAVDPCISSDMSLSARWTQRAVEARPQPSSHFRYF